MLTDALRLKLFDRLFIEAVGGPQIADLLYEYHEHHQSYADLSKSTGIPAMTIHRQLVKARMLLRRLELMPPHWEARAPKSKATV